MDRYCVWGNPVAHSRSPFIHARFAQLTGQRMAYTAELAPLDGFAHSVRAFFDAGGMGCNVTIPFKHEAAQFADECSDHVRLCGAANTLVRLSDGRVCAHNTDGAGLVADITQHAAQSIAGARILLVGAGGGAAGVLAALLEQRPSEIIVVNRTAERAVQLVQRHADFGAQPRPKLAFCPLGHLGELGAFDLIINATAASLGQDQETGAGFASPIPASTIAPNALVYDLMYGAAARPFLHWAAAHGARTRDGLGMLVEQAASAFALWRGVRPASAGVLAELRAAVDAAAANR